MDVDPSSSKHHCELDGHDYYFCSVGCMTAFEGHPGAYVHASTFTVGRDHAFTATTPAISTTTCQ